MTPFHDTPKPVLLNILTFCIQNDTIKCLQDLHTVLQPLLRFKQPKSSVLHSKETISATVHAAFIYVHILSLTRDAQPTFLREDPLKCIKFVESQTKIICI